MKSLTTKRRVAKDMRVPAAVKELRSRLGESQQAFSNRLGLSLRAVANYDAGARPAREVLEALSMIAEDLGHADLAIVFGVPKTLEEYLLGRVGRRWGLKDTRWVMNRVSLISPPSV